MTKAQIIAQVKQEQIELNPLLTVKNYRLFLSHLDKITLVTKMLLRARELENIYG